MGTTRKNSSITNTKNITAVQHAFELIKKDSLSAHDDLSHEEYFSFSANDFASENETVSEGSLLIFYFNILENLFGAGIHLFENEDLEGKVQKVFTLSKKKNTPLKQILLEVIKNALYQIAEDTRESLYTKERNKIKSIVHEHLSTIKNMDYMAVIDPIYKILTMKHEGASDKEFEKELKLFWKKYTT